MSSTSFFISDVNATLFLHDIMKGTTYLIVNLMLFVSSGGTNIAYHTTHHSDQTIADNIAAQEMPTTVSQVKNIHLTQGNKP